MICHSMAVRSRAAGWPPSTQPPAAAAALAMLTEPGRAGRPLKPHAVGLVADHRSVRPAADSLRRNLDAIEDPVAGDHRLVGVDRPVAVPPAAAPGAARHREPVVRIIGVPERADLAGPVALGRAACHLGAE